MKKHYYGAKARGDFMKKGILSLLVLTAFTATAAYSSGEIGLSNGQSVTIGGTTVTCGSTSPSTPASQCSRLKSMTSEEVYIYGHNYGVGNCYIISNQDHYGVMHSSRGQISPTYKVSHSGRASYNTNSYSASTGFVQLVCNGQCLRP
jgi:hypothetical protein